MSRTYKDRPYRVKSADKKLKNNREYHYCGNHDYSINFNECLIDEIAPPGSYRIRCSRTEVGRRESMYKDERNFYQSSHRVEELMVLGKVVREYNSQGYIEDDYILTPHIKNALFGGGHWN